jgi:xanthine dehydrogenase small subunit
MHHLELEINGRRIREPSVSPTTTLLAYLRNHLGLTGTKEGCAEGDCGACTVAVLDPSAPGGPTYRAVNSCLVLLPMVQGKKVFTVEALAKDGTPHPAQKSLVEHLGSQCGYCTPGVVMSMFEACYRRDLDEPWKLDDQLCGNLCRCTGYRPIREATQEIAGTMPKDRFSEALSGARPSSMALAYAHGSQHFFTPSSFEELWSILDAHPEARFVNGGTDLSLEVTKLFKTLPTLISVEELPGMSSLDRRADRWIIGAGVRLSDLEAASRDTFPSIERMLRFFGSRQIKHRATAGGNVCNASPIGDLPPILLALGAKVITKDKGGDRSIPIEEFFVSYRRTALRPGEIVTAIEVPIPTAGARVAAYKVSKRQELDISTVAAGLYVLLDGDRVADARFGFGGMAATPSRAKSAERVVIGRLWNEETLEAAVQELDRDFRPIDDHRGSAWYRRALAKNLMRGFFLETAREPSPRLPHRPTGTVKPEVTS